MSRTSSRSRQSAEPQGAKPEEGGFGPLFLSEMHCSHDGARGYARAMQRDKSSRAPLWLLGTAIGASLLIWAVLSHRQDSRPETPSAEDESPVQAPRPAASLADAERELPEDGSPGSSNASREAIAYFQRISSIQSSWKQSDPEVLALAITQASLQGDARRLDAIIEDADRVRAEVERVDAPACCEEHHRATVRMLGESKQMLAELREAMTGNDLPDLSLVADHVQALEARARALEAMEAQILSGKSRTPSR